MSAPPAWTAVVPVKHTDVAKSRLAGTDDARRRRLAVAFALDTVSALLACPRVGHVLVVTNDEDAGGLVRVSGAQVVPDLPDAGLNPAVAYGASIAARARPGDGVLLVSSDLPALRAAEVTAVLEDAARHPRAFVCDASGIGTTVLTAAPGVEPAPAFGTRSRAAHRRTGAVEIDRDEIASVRRDVDTWVDLWDAVRLGVGPATRDALAEA